MSKLSFVDFALECDFTPMPYQVDILNWMWNGSRFVFSGRPALREIDWRWRLQLNEMMMHWMAGEMTEARTLLFEYIDRPVVIYDEFEFKKAYLNEWKVEEE